MSIDIILYIITLMIFYDFSIHLVYLFKKEEFFLKRKLNWWPKWDMWGKKERMFYQIFWNTYWGSAFILMVLYLIFR